MLLQHTVVGMNAFRAHDACPNVSIRSSSATQTPARSTYVEKSISMRSQAKTHSSKASAVACTPGFLKEPLLVSQCSRAWRLMNGGATTRICDLIRATVG
jgi:hypothetical protein